MYNASAYSIPTFKSMIKTKPIDKKIFKLAKPATLNYVMVPIVGMVDTFWVSKLGSANELAGAGSGDQIFSIFYVITSFLPAIITPKISELEALDKKKETNELITISILLTNILGIISSFLMFIFSKQLTDLFVGSNPIINSCAVEYLKYRSYGLPFVLTNSLIFSIFRGFMDFNSAIKVNVKSQLINLVLDPFFMNYFGLKGVAIASVLSDIYCTCQYLKLLIIRKRYSKKIKNFFKTSCNLLGEGFFVQIKNTLNNFMYLYINKKILLFDSDGSLLASNIILIKFLHLCFITFSGLYSVSNILIPIEKVAKKDYEAKNRLMLWSICIGLLQSIILLNSKFLFPYLTSDTKVINICENLIGYISIYQIFYGYSYVLEGILQGYQKFNHSGIANIISLVPTIILLLYSKNLTSIWCSLIFTTFLKCIYINFILKSKK